MTKAGNTMTNQSADTTESTDATPPTIEEITNGIACSVASYGAQCILGCGPPVEDRWIEFRRLLDALANRAEKAEREQTELRGIVDDIRAVFECIDIPDNELVGCVRALSADRDYLRRRVRPFSDRAEKAEQELASAREAEDRLDAELTRARNALAAAALPDVVSLAENCTLSPADRTQRLAGQAEATSASKLPVALPSDEVMVRGLHESSFGGGDIRGEQLRLRTAEWWSAPYRSDVVKEATAEILRIIREIAAPVEGQPEAAPDVDVAAIEEALRDAAIALPATSFTEQLVWVVERLVERTGRVSQLLAEMDDAHDVLDAVIPRDCPDDPDVEPSLHERVSLLVEHLMEARSEIESARDAKQEDGEQAANEIQDPDTSAWPGTKSDDIHAELVHFRRCLVELGRDLKHCGTPQEIGRRLLGRMGEEGGWPVGTINAVVPLRDKKGGDPSEWPADLRVREFPEES